MGAAWLFDLCHEEKPRINFGVYQNSGSRFRFQPPHHFKHRNFVNGDFFVGHTAAFPNAAQLQARNKVTRSEVSPLQLGPVINASNLSAA